MTIYKSKAMTKLPNIRLSYGIDRRTAPRIEPMKSEDDYSTQPLEVVALAVAIIVTVVCACIGLVVWLWPSVVGVAV